MVLYRRGNIHGSIKTTAKIRFQLDEVLQERRRKVSRI